MDEREWDEAFEGHQQALRALERAARRKAEMLMDAIKRWAPSGGPTESHESDTDR